MKKLLNFLHFIVITTLLYPIIVFCCLFCALETFIEQLGDITKDILKECIKQIKRFSC